MSEREELVSPEDSKDTANSTHNWLQAPQSSYDLKSASIIRLQKAMNFRIERGLEGDDESIKLGIAIRILEKDLEKPEPITTNNTQNLVDLTLYDMGNPGSLGSLNQNPDRDFFYDALDASDSE